MFFLPSFLPSVLSFFLIPPRQWFTILLSWNDSCWEPVSPDYSNLIFSLQVVLLAGLKCSGPQYQSVASLWVFLFLLVDVHKQRNKKAKMFGTLRLSDHWTPYLYKLLSLLVISCLYFQVNIQTPLYKVVHTSFKSGQITLTQLTCKLFILFLKVLYHLLPKS